MFVEQDTIQIFPCPVWLFNVDAERTDRLNQQVHTAIKQLREAESPGAPEMHWQSPNDLQTRNDFADLVDTIHEATKEIFAELRVPTDAFLVTGLWVNYRPPWDRPSSTYTSQQLPEWNVLCQHSHRGQCNRFPRPPSRNKHNRSQIF